MTTKWLLDPVEDDIDEDEGLTKLEILQMLAEDLGYMIEPTAARMLASAYTSRLQNAVNWAARSAYIHAGAANAHFIAHVMPELKALDDGAKLEEPEVKS